MAYGPSFYSSPPIIETDGVDVSADRVDDCVHFNFKMDLGNLLLINIILNMIAILLLILFIRR